MIHCPFHSGDYLEECGPGCRRYDHDNHRCIDISTRNSIFDVAESLAKIAKFLDILTDCVHQDEDGHFMRSKGGW